MPKTPRIADIKCHHLLSRSAAISVWSATEKGENDVAVISFSSFGRAWPAIFSKLLQNQVAVRAVKEASGRVALVVAVPTSATDQAPSQSLSTTDVLLASESWLASEGLIATEGLLEILASPQVSAKFYFDHGWVDQDVLASGPQSGRVIGARLLRKPWFIATAVGLGVAAVVAGMSIGAVGSGEQRAGQASAAANTQGTANDQVAPAPAQASAAAQVSAAAQAPAPASATARHLTLLQVRAILNKATPFSSVSFDPDLALDAFVAKDLSVAVLNSITLGGMARLVFKVEGFAGRVDASYQASNNVWSLVGVQAQK